MPRGIGLIRETNRGAMVKKNESAEAERRMAPSCRGAQEKAQIHLIVIGTLAVVGRRRPTW